MKIHNHIIPKAIRRHSIRLWLATAITMTATLAVLTGCSADNEPENPTGGDGTSVTFGATIATREGHDNGNAPTSRAIPDGTFEEGDWILVHIDGERKVFVYRTADGGFVHDPSISSLNIDPTPPEWKSGETGKDVLAYGPTGVIMYDVNEGYVFQCAVAKDQSKDKDYEGRDYVYAAQSLDRGNPALTFRHGMTRVVVRLRPGGSLTSEEVAGASVLLGDKNIFLVADIDPQTGTLTAHVPTGGNQLQPQTVTPHRCAATPTGYAVAYEALLPPQDVSGKLFISARLSNGTELGYAAESGSMLEGGGRAWAGGIVGWNLANGDGNTSTLFACRAEGSVSLTGAGTSTDAQPLCAGGIAGKNNNNNDYSNTDANILACVATGAVTAAYTGADAVQAWAGGLVGYLGEGGYLLYSYARGTATATAGGNASGHAGAIVGGYDGSSAVDFCFGAGEGGKGTSGLEERVGDIAYNTAPGDSEIWNIITSSDWIFPGISTTFYDASATPAYGINVSERNYNSDVWLRDDRCWPVLDMENNGN